MKSVILILALILAVSYSFHLVEHKNSKDILNLLEAGDNKVYIILFYSPGQKGGMHNKQTSVDEKELLARVLERYPSFHYAKVNAEDKEYADLVKACGVNRGELHESPSVLIIEGGVGAWVHGPQTVNKIEEFAYEYARRAERAH